jgi:hypothetical protein
MQTLQRPLSTREIERRLSRANRRADTAPSQTAAQKVVIRLDPDVATVEEELCLLGALEALKQQHDKVQLVYAYRNKEIGAAIRNRWFLKDAAICSCEETFDRLVGTAFGLTVAEPDPEAAFKAEQEIYEVDYQRRLAEVQGRQAAAQQAGVKDLVIPEPDHFFHPRWHRTNGYLWQVSEELGLLTKLPTEPIAPYSAFSQDLVREVLRPLQKAKLTAKPFVLFDFSAEADILALMKSLGEALPGYELVSLQELTRVIGNDAVSLTAALSQKSHRNADGKVLPVCRYAVGPVGPMLTAAWAAGVPNILCLYSGANFQWDGLHAPNTFSVARDRLTDEQMPQSLIQALSFLTDKAKRKGTR